MGGDMESSRSLRFMGKSGIKFPLVNISMGVRYREEYGKFQVSEVYGEGWQ